MGDVISLRPSGAKNFAENRANVAAGPAFLPQDDIGPLAHFLGAHEMQRHLALLPVLALLALNTGCPPEKVVDDITEMGDAAARTAPAADPNSIQQQADAANADNAAGNDDAATDHAGDAQNAGGTNAGQAGGGVPANDPGAGNAGTPTAPGAGITIGDCATNTYVGDLHGAQATARLVIEPLPNYTYVEGEISSDFAYYTFTAEIIGDRGWGDMLDHLTLERFRVQFDVAPNGFYLTSNPFLAPTTYIFTCN